MQIAPFRIFRKSINRNSFGLRGYWAIGPDDNVWTFGDHGEHEVGDSAALPCNKSVSPGSPDMLRPAMELCCHQGKALNRAKLLAEFKVVEEPNG